MTGEESGSAIELAARYLKWYTVYRMIPSLLFLGAFMFGLREGDMPLGAKVDLAILAFGIVMGALMFEVYLQNSGGGFDVE